MTFDNFIRSFLKIDKGLKENMPQSYLWVMANVEVSKALKTKAFIKNDVDLQDGLLLNMKNFQIFVSLVGNWWM